MQVKQGDLYYADLNPVTGSEQGGVRPVLIIQGDIGNRYSSTVIIAAVTSRHKAEIPTHFEISGYGLRERSTVLLEQIRTIDKSRLRERIGHISPEVMELVMQRLDVSFGRVTKTKERGAESVEVQNLTVKQVNFNGDSLLAVKDNATGKVHISVNHICKGLGIDAENQRTKLREHMTISKGTTLLGVPSAGGNQSTFVIELEFLPLWLAGINPAKVNPDIQEKLVNYQLKAKDVLAEAFIGKLLRLPQTYAEALRELADKVEENQKLKSENEQLKPAAEFGLAIKNNDGLILIRDYVKILANAEIKIRQHELFAWLVKRGYIYQNTKGDYLPRIEYVDMELFKVHESPIETKSHGSFISYTTRLTGKGQDYFLRKLKEERSCQLQ